MSVCKLLVKLSALTAEFGFTVVSHVPTFLENNLVDTLFGALGRKKERRERF